MINDIAMKIVDELMETVRCDRMMAIILLLGLTVLYASVIFQFARMLYRKIRFVIYAKDIHKDRKGRESFLANNLVPPLLKALMFAGVSGYILFCLMKLYASYSDRDCLYDIFLLIQYTSVFGTLYICTMHTAKKRILEALKKRSPEMEEKLRKLQKEKEARK